MSHPFPNTFRIYETVDVTCRSRVENTELIKGDTERYVIELKMHELTGVILLVSQEKAVMVIKI